MTRSEGLSAALASADPAEAAAAIIEMHDQLLTASTVPVRLPETTIAVPPDDQDEFLSKYLRVLKFYPFDPPLSASERLSRGIDIVLHEGGTYAARQLALQLVIEDATSFAIEYISARGIDSVHEIDQAGWLLSYLLDDEQTRAATIGALRSWMGRAGLKRIIHSEATRLTSEERATLGLS